MNHEEIIHRAQSARWFHSIELFPGYTTPGHKPIDVMRFEEDRFLGALNLRGASLIDVGSYTGYFAFAAKRHGAGRVIATDSYVWKNDPPSRAAFDLARECLAQEIGATEIDPADFPGGLPISDIVLFLGVFYHLWSPMEVLSKVAKAASRALVVETHLDALYLQKPAMIHYPGTELADDPTNWWGPNIPCMYALLRQVGFEQVIYTHGAVSSVLHPARGIFYAFRTKADADDLFARRIDNIEIFNLSNDEARADIVGRIADYHRRHKRDD